MTGDETPLLRELAPRVLAALVRRFADFAAAEDAVQEALLAAAEQWPADGTPVNPLGWLIHVAARRMADHVRVEVARRRREELVVSLIPAEDQLALPADAPRERDDSLDLFIQCCHPSLSSASAIALTLRAVGGLTTAEIARAFLVPEATMAQRISRAKQTIKASGVGFGMPDEAARQARLEPVKHTLYLLFNEGYTASSGPELARVDLSSEAIRLTRMLLALVPDDTEAAGLLALMLLTDARRLARTGPAGELIPLDEQDRSRWDAAMIVEGVALLGASLPRGALGPYQVQAAIAALHDEAGGTETTDWPQILALYGVLARLNESPMVALNRAVALAMVDGPLAGLAEVERIASRLPGHHRVEAVRAHLLERAGRPEEARTAYARAAALATSVPERDYLLVRAARLGGS